MSSNDSKGNQEDNGLVVGGSSPSQSETKMNQPVENTSEIQMHSEIEQNTNFGTQARKDVPLASSPGADAIKSTYNPMSNTSSNDMAPVAGMVGSVPSSPHSLYSTNSPYPTSGQNTPSSSILRPTSLLRASSGMTRGVLNASLARTSQPNWSRSSSTASSPVTSMNLPPTNKTSVVDFPKQPLRFSKLPPPMNPSECHLLCVFYAEFDNSVGPKVYADSPVNFMSKDIHLTLQEARQALCTTFTKVQVRSNENEIKSNEEENNTSGTNEEEKRPDWTVFDAISDYIFSQSEFFDQLLCVSTQQFHILTLPTQLSDAKYDRNALRFTVGFVLSQNVDTWPYRPVLAKVVASLKAMELESQFLSSPSHHQRIEATLEGILISLNSQEGEANLLLDEANHLNVKLFASPSVVVDRVPDHVVPVLLRPEWQLQSYDWDLTINWIIPHIDGVKYAKQIAQASEMDDEMCAACLQVLKQHGVVALLDVFRYSNLYEPTPLAASLLQSNSVSTTLMNMAYLYVIKAKHTIKEPDTRQTSSVGLDLSRSNHTSTSFGVGALSRPIPRVGMSFSPLHSVGVEDPNMIQILRPSSYGTRLPVIPSMAPNGRSLGSDVDSEDPAVLADPLESAVAAMSPMSYPPRFASSSNSMSSYVARHQQPNNPYFSLNSYEANRLTSWYEAMKLPEEQQAELKAAMVQLYTSLERTVSVGELLLRKFQQTQHTPPAAAQDDNISPREQEKTQNGFPVTSPKSLPSQDEEDNMIDWIEALDFIDHRRFITFGLIHGLIRRVHRFPVAHDVLGVELELTDPMSLVSLDSEDLEEGIMHDFDSENVSYDEYDETYYPQRAHALSIDSNDSYLKVAAQPEPEPSPEELDAQARQFSLGIEIAHSMDGFKCDDELTCRYEMPLEDLVALVEKTERYEVSYIYRVLSPK